MAHKSGASNGAKKINAFNDGKLEGVNVADAKNLMVPDGLQGKYKKKKQIEDYHKNKLKPKPQY